jgi:hypothetical protein
MCDGVQLVCWIIYAGALVLSQTAGGLEEQVCSSAEQEPSASNRANLRKSSLAHFHTV